MPFPALPFFPLPPSSFSAIASLMVSFFSRAMSPWSFTHAHCSMTLTPGGGGGVAGKMLFARIVAIGVCMFGSVAPAAGASVAAASAAPAPAPAPAAAAAAAAVASTSGFPSIATTASASFSAFVGVAAASSDAVAAAADRRARGPSSAATAAVSFFTAAASSPPPPPSPPSAAAGFFSGTSVAADGTGFSNALDHAFFQNAATSLATAVHRFFPSSVASLSRSRLSGVPFAAAHSDPIRRAAASFQSLSAAKSLAIHRISTRT